LAFRTRVSAEPWRSALIRKVLELTVNDSAAQLDQPFDAGSLYRLRAAVAAHLTGLGLPLYQANDIVIAVHELASNTVRHGAGHGQLTIRSLDGTIICEISEAAVARRTDARPPAVAGLDGLPWAVESGHGLWLVGEVADQLTVRRDSEGVTATISFLT
jgi:anti-sigma regulatory factor (Ser/Thr protein kinase)